MFKNFIEWRRTNNIDNVLLDFKNEVQDLTELKKFYQHGWHGIDKQGRPIYLERGGYFDGDALINLKGQEWMNKYI